MKKIANFITLLIILVLTGCTNEPNVYPIIEADNYVNNFEDEKQNLQLVEISADAMHFNDLEGLTDFASELIRGIVLGESAGLSNVHLTQDEARELLLNEGLTIEEVEYELSLFTFTPQYGVVTTYLVEVLEVFQGKLSVGDIIEVRRTGGIYQGEFWFVRDQVTVTPGEEFVMFLRENIGDRPFVFASTFQGVYQVDDILRVSYNSMTEIADVSTELENTGDRDELIVTIEDLIDIAEGTLSSESSRQRRNARRRDRN